MATIDKLGPDIHFRYAQQSQIIEDFKNTYHYSDAYTIPSQTELFNLSGQASALENLFGIKGNKPWGEFTPPPKFSEQRRSPFLAYRLLNLDTNEDEDLFLERLGAVVCSSEEEERHKQTLQNCLEKVMHLSGEITFISNRRAQFVQA